MFPKLPILPPTRRPLEGGTLLMDFLGESNVIARTRQLERRLDEVDAAMLSSSAAEQSYARRRGALLFTGWGQPTVAANQTNVTLVRFGVSWQAPLILPFAGSVTSLMVGLSNQQTAGTLTAKVYIAGSASGLEAVIDDNTRLIVAESAPVGECAFEAGEQITLRVTTSSNWAPTSADVMAMIEVDAA